MILELFYVLYILYNMKDNHYIFCLSVCGIVARASNKSTEKILRINLISAFRVECKNSALFLCLKYNILFLVVDLFIPYLILKNLNSTRAVVALPKGKIKIIRR